MQKLKNDLPSKKVIIAVWNHTISSSRYVYLFEVDVEMRRCFETVSILGIFFSCRFLGTAQQRFCTQVSEKSEQHKTFYLMSYYFWFQSSLVPRGSFTSFLCQPTTVIGLEYDGKRGLMVIICSSRWLWVETNGSGERASQALAHFAFLLGKLLPGLTETSKSLKYTKTIMIGHGKRTLVAYSRVTSLMASVYVPLARGVLKTATCVPYIHASTSTETIRPEIYPVVSKHSQILIFFNYRLIFIKVEEFRNLPKYKQTTCLDSSRTVHRKIESYKPPPKYLHAEKVLR